MREFFGVLRANQAGRVEYDVTNKKREPQKTAGFHFNFRLLYKCNRKLTRVRTVGLVERTRNALFEEADKQTQSTAPLLSVRLCSSSITRSYFSPPFSFYLRSLFRLTTGTTRAATYQRLTVEVQRARTPGRERIGAAHRQLRSRHAADNRRGT